MIIAIITIVVFIASLVQGAIGFGGALIAMPILVALLGVQTAAPAFALVILVATFLNAVRWRAFVTRPDVARLLLPALIGIPLGVWGLSKIDSALVVQGLGIVIILYAAYALLRPTVPRLNNNAWAYTAGFSSGILTGAYNTGGPPVIVYANARQWGPDQFRGNLQTYFLFSSIVVVISHWVAGHYSPAILQTALWAIPALIIGQIAGVRLARHLQPDFFRRVVLVVLMLIGLRLLFF